MSAEYIIHFSDGTTDGPYTEEELLDMVDADELSAGAVCEDTVSGKRLRVRQLFQVIPPASPPSSKSAKGKAGNREEHLDEAEPDDAEMEEEDPPEPPPTRARWIPAPLPEETEDDDRPAAQAPLRTFYTGSPSLLNYPVSLVLSVLLAAGGWYAGRWDGAYLAGGWIAGCALLAGVIFLRNASEYRVTNRRVEARLGLFSKSSREIRIGDIRSINVSKSGLKGLLGVGTVIFSSSGGTEEDVVFRQIWRAHGVKDLVRLLQDRPG